MSACRASKLMAAAFDGDGEEFGWDRVRGAHDVVDVGGIQAVVDADELRFLHAPSNGAWRPPVHSLMPDVEDAGYDVAIVGIRLIQDDRQADQVDKVPTARLLTVPRPSRVR